MDEWIEGENHVFEKDSESSAFRYIYLRNGGSFELILYILGHRLDLLREFWDVGVTINSQQRGVSIGGYFFEIYPTVGDLFLISLFDPKLLPLLNANADISSEVRHEAKRLLQEKVTRITLAKYSPKPKQVEQDSVILFQQSNLRKSRIITGDVAQKVDRFIAEHKTHVLTIMFTDLVGSTAINDKLGEIEATKMRKIHDEIINKIIAMKKNGKVIKTIGDSFMVAFSKPSVAITTALMIQKALHLYNQKRVSENAFLNVRIGIHMGEVSVETTKGWDIFGQHVNIASRVESLADSAQVLTTRTVYDSCKSWLIGGSYSSLKWESHGDYSLKGIKEAVSIFEVYDSKIKAPKAPAKIDQTNEIVLLVDDEDIYLKKYRDILNKQFDLILATDGETGLEKVKKYKPAVIVTDLRMPPGEWGGLFLIEKAREVSPQSKIIVLSSSGHLKMAVETIKLGASDYIEKTNEHDALTQIVFESMNPLANID